MNEELRMIAGIGEQNADRQITSNHPIS